MRLRPATAWGAAAVGGTLALPGIHDVFGAIMEGSLDGPEYVVAHYGPFPNRLRISS